MRVKLRSWLSFCLGLILWLSGGATATAADVSVTARILDTTPPSAPILISPEDGAVINHNKPNFKWYAAADDAAISHYVLYVDGQILFNNLPLGDFENSSYQLVYDAFEDTYTLTVKQALADGQHSWRVMVYDYGNNSNSSATWNFRIDTLVPFFTVQQLGDVGVNISANNPSSVPATPVILFANDPWANEPVIKAIGEAYSKVQLTVTIPGQATQIINQDIDVNGNWSRKLGILPRDTDIRLDFLIIDQVGHVSVLEKLYIRIALQYWPTSSPTPTTTGTIAPSLTPTPTLSLTIRPSITPSVSPTLSLSPSPTASPSAEPTAEPTGIIPIMPPREIIHEIGVDIGERLPTPLAEKLREWFASAAWDGLSRVIALYLLLLFYVLMLVSLLSKFVGSLSGPLLREAAWFFWPWLRRERPHLVFEYRDTQPAAFVKVELWRSQAGQQVLEAVRLTERTGNFADLPWPESGDYWLKVVDANYYFPVGVDKPRGLGAQQFYQQELLSQANQQRQRAFIIPTLRAQGQTQLPWLERWRLACLQLLSYPWWWWGLSLLIGLIFALRYGGVANYLAILFYLLVLVQKLWRHYRERRAWQSIVIKKDPERVFSGELVAELSNSHGQCSQASILVVEDGHVQYAMPARATQLELYSKNVVQQVIDLSRQDGVATVILGVSS